MARSVKQRRLRSRLEDSFYEFIKAAWPVVEPATYIDNWHIAMYADHLQALDEGRIDKLLVNIPPGTSKSLVTSVFWPAWRWTRNPGLRMMFASYSAALSNRDAIKCRVLLDSPFYRSMWGHRVELETDSQVYYSTSKGGWRLATSPGGRGTGEHPDTVICFPAGTEIETENGPAPIESIDVGVRVLTRCERTGKVGLRPVVRTFKNSSRVRKILTSTRTLRLTGNHPVWVAGRGWVDANRIKVGDAIHAFQVRHLPAGFQSSASTCGSDRKDRNLLLPQMPRAIDQGRQTPSLRGREAEVQKLWQDDCRCVGSSSENGVGVFPEMRDGIREEAPSMDSHVLRMREGLSRNCWASQEVVGLLQSEMFERGSSQGNRKSAIRSWERAGGISAGVQTTAPPRDKTGQADVSPLREDQNAKRTRDGCSPHRLQQREQHDGQPDQPLQLVSWKGRWRGEDAEILVEKVISVDDEDGTGADAVDVYNLEVFGTNTYFANGVFVHNCDDPHSVEQAESDTERQSVVNWWDLTISTRGLTRKITRVIVMQRLHENDLSGHVLEHEPGDWTHVCLPLEYEAGRMPPSPVIDKRTGLAWVDPRAQEGEVLNAQMFDAVKIAKLKRALGSYGYAGQGQQRPTLRTGGMFETDKMVRLPKSEAPDAFDRMARFWDKADNDGDGDFASGVMIGRRGNRFYVLDVENDQLKAAGVLDRVATVAGRDASVWGQNAFEVGWGETVGDAGSLVDSTYRERLRGYRVFSERETGSKQDRAEPWAIAVGNNEVFVVEDHWTQRFIDQHQLFPKAKNDDMVDAAGGSYRRLCERKKGWMAGTGTA